MLKGSGGRIKGRRGAMEDNSEKLWRRMKQKTNGRKENRQIQEKYEL